VSAFEKTGEFKFVPTLASVLDAVEMDLKLMIHLLHRQALCQSEGPMRAHLSARVRVIDPHFV
jgi:hypothetical protein